MLCEKGIQVFEYYLADGDGHVHFDCLQSDTKRHLEGLAQFDF